MAWILKEEIDNDPLGRGYAGMTDQEVTDDMLTECRSISVGSVLGEDVVAALVPSEVNALTVVQQRNLWGIIGAGSVKPNDAEVKSYFANLFGAGTATRANLLALATRLISRAAELGVRVGPGLVAEARRAP